MEDGTFTLTIPQDVNSSYMTSVSYSTDNGETWTTTNVDNTAQTITTPTINTGDKVLWKGIGKKMGYWTYENKGTTFMSTCRCNVLGNIMSMLYGDNFINQITFPENSTWSFAGLFSNIVKLIDASNLILPATTLVDACYYHMFEGCVLLTKVPDLPVTTLVNNCYNGMFKDCTALTTAPELPATTVADSCYQNMFNGCTSLITAPELPATTLTSWCYSSMFQNCSSLNKIVMLGTTFLGTSQLLNWVQGVAVTGTFIKATSATIPNGNSGIPTGWTVETASE